MHARRGEATRVCVCGQIHAYYGDKDSCITPVRLDISIWEIAFFDNLPTECVYSTVLGVYRSPPS